MWKINIFLVLVELVLLVSPVWAFDLTLTKIGTMSTIGADYSVVSYVGAVPALEGTATPAAQVLVKINSTTANVLAATTSGVWTFLPTVLNTGDNTVVVTSGTQSLSFVLSYNSGALPTPIATIEANLTVLPATGAWEYLVVGLFVGICVWYLGGEIKRKMKVWEGK